MLVGAFLSADKVISIFSVNRALLDEYTGWRGEDYTLDVRFFAELGSLMLAKDYCRAQQMRTLVWQDFASAFREGGVDVIVVPTTAATAKTLPDTPGESLELEYSDGYREDVMWSYCRYTVPISLSSCPSLSTPCGFAGDGLPIGMQIVAAPFDEERAFQVGHAYELATDWGARHPSKVMEAVASTAE